MKKLSEVIKETTRDHLKNNGMLFAQCVTAVGWIGGTVPDEINIYELPTSDSSNGSIVTGAALSQRRPIYVIRYQGFGWYNLVSILNYAAKSKEMWNVPCPLFVRALAMEGNMGPVASGSFHNLPMSMPGIDVFAPVTPNEWIQTWNHFIKNDNPVYCSEHRKTFDINYEIEDVIINEPEVTIFGISYSRLNILKILNGKKISYAKIMCLKPSYYTEESIASLKKSKFGIVVDSGPTICGASQSLAYELMIKTGKPVYALGLEDKTTGFYNDNCTPNESRILSFIEAKKNEFQFNNANSK